MKSPSADDYVGKWVVCIDDTDCLYITNGYKYFVDRVDPYLNGKLVLKDKVYSYSYFRFKIINNKYKKVEEWL